LLICFPICFVEKFEIIGSPVYAGCITTQDKNLGMAIINEALKAVEEAIIAKKGTYKLRAEVISTEKITKTKWGGIFTEAN